MILESIHVRNLLSHDDSLVDFRDSPLWLIWGKNGAGKSALFDAFEYALYGSHRAGDGQNMKFLVKHGAETATVEVTLQLRGERYRITHWIDAQRGKRAAKKAGRRAMGAPRGNNGRVARWDAAANDWISENAGGESSEAIWNWLAPRLPAHDLFRSAIYLRQADTSHFFSGNAKQRNERFAALIDLGPYTRLAEKAKKRHEAANRKGAAAEAKLEELGDIGDDALHGLETLLEAAGQAVTVTEREVEDAVVIRAGAARWNQLQGELVAYRAEGAELEALIREGTAIAAAAQRVTAWDDVAVRLERHWQRRAEAEKMLQRATDAHQEADKLASMLERKQVDLERAKSTHSDLEGTHIPEAEAQARDLDRQARALGHEAEIGAARATAEAAAQEAAQLLGKDEELDAWKARDLALSDLRQLAEARAAANEATTAITDAEKACTAALEPEQAARNAREVAEMQRDEQARAAQAVADRLVELAVAIAGCRAGMDAHGRLEGDEAVCPVCDQQLDEAAHDHVRETLAKEHAQLETLELGQKTAEQTKRAADKTLKAAQTAVDKSHAALHDAAEQVTRTEGDLAHVKDSARRAAKRLAERQMTVAQEHPHYAAMVDQVTAEWVAEERERVRTGMRVAQEGADGLEAALRKGREADIRISVMRDQRAPEAVPLGEQQPADALRTQQKEAQASAQNWATELKRLRDEAHTLLGQIRALERAVSELELQIKSNNSQAAKDETRAGELTTEADTLGQALGQAWLEFLADEGRYQAEDRAIEQLRPLAAKASELLRAQGRLEKVRQDEEKAARAQLGIPREHQLPLEAAETAEADARDRLRDAQDEQVTLANRRTDLVERRQRGAAYAAEAGKAAEAAEDWRLLADLLKAGGTLQAWIVNREQQQIVREVNLVLQQLDDPLRVQVGDPQRKNSAEAQDVVALDLTDPLQEPKHYNLLSGGEQFRVALALALALHRRVAGGAAGTLIVDEGFGALDSDRRDSLAQQMADSGGGLLRLGLAQSVLICSHSSEVERHFPNRWIVEKQGGTATVHPESDDDSYDNVNSPEAEAKPA